MTLEEIEMQIGYYLEKGRTEGLEKSDANKIKKIYHHLIKLNLQDNERWHKDMTILYQILDQYDKQGIYTGFIYDSNYIIQNAFILPLVMANNKGPIKVEEKRIAFNSQFASDNKGLMFVNISSNEVICKKSHSKFHNIPYLRQVESISRSESPLLLCYIFNYKIPKEIKELRELSEKYKRVIMSSEYKELLYRIFEESDPNLQSKLNEIMRVENDIYDPDFVYKEAPQRLYLK